MELSPKQQINDLVKKSEKVLILSHARLGGDAIGGMLALAGVLRKIGKEVSVVSSETIEDTLSFLPGISEIKEDISGTRDFVVQFDKDKIGIEKLSYNEEGNLLNIIITPKDGQIRPEDVKLLQGEYKFDLIFVLDTPDVDKIDSVYDRHTELFFETPIVNIDHHVGNEYFGTVNMVDLTATSTCEILVSVIESLGANNFDSDVATCLLTGIIADTGSFKNSNTTPKSLTISAQMLAAGARQQEVIQNLYKTRPLGALKLWGRVLSRLEHDKDHRMIWSYVTYKDFEETGASLEEIRTVMDELLMSTPGADVVLLLAEHEPTKVAGKLKGLHGQDVLAIAELFGGSGQVQSAGFDLSNTDIEKAIPEIVEKVRDFRDVQLGRSPKPKFEKPEEKEIPKQVEEPKTEAHNHIEQDKLAKKIEESEPKLNNEVEVKDLFNKFIGAETEAEGPLIEENGHVDEKKEFPIFDPIVQALESLEHEDDMPLRGVENDESISPISRSEQSEGSQHSEQNSSANAISETPTIDVNEVKTENKPFQALGEIFKEYNPTKNETVGPEPKPGEDDIRTL